MSGSGLLLCNLSSKPPFRRSQFSENRRKPIAFIWLGSEAELRAQVAEPEANAFRVFVLSWKGPALANRLNSTARKILSPTVPKRTDHIPGAYTRSAPVALRSSSIFLTPLPIVLRIM